MIFLSCVGAYASPRAVVVVVAAAVVAVGPAPPTPVDVSWLGVAAPITAPSEATSVAWGAAVVAFAANVLSSARAAAVVAAPAVVVTSAVSSAPPERNTPTLIMTAKNATTATVTGIHGLNLLRLLDQNEGCARGHDRAGRSGRKEDLADDLVFETGGRVLERHLLHERCRPTSERPGERHTRRSVSRCASTAAWVAASSVPSR